MFIGCVKTWDVKVCSFCYRRSETYIDVCEETYAELVVALAAVECLDRQSSINMIGLDEAVACRGIA